MFVIWLYVRVSVAFVHVHVVVRCAYVSFNISMMQVPQGKHYLVMAVWLCYFKEL